MTSQSFEYQGMTYTWDGPLTEFTELTSDAGTTSLNSLIAMTNGDVLASLPTSAVSSDDEPVAAGGSMEIAEAFAARGIVASGAVLSREGRINPLQDPARAVDLLLGEDGFGRSFDALVASEAVDKPNLLATAVERSHDFYGIPAILASGDARRWAESLDDETVENMLYVEAPEAYVASVTGEIVDAARQSMRERVYRG